MVDEMSTPRDFLSRKVASVTKKPQNDEGNMTLAGRIRGGMQIKGIDTAADLARRMKLNRQTIHKWLSGEVTKLEPAHLFKLADILGLDARWLAAREGEPQPALRITLELQRLIELYQALPEKMRRAWILSGDAILQETGETSIAQPYRRSTVKR